MQERCTIVVQSSHRGRMKRKLQHSLAFSTTTLLVSSYARGAWASEEKSLWEAVSKLTGRYSCAHTDGGTHAGARLLPGTVDPTRIRRVAAKQAPGRQQRHHRHLRVTRRLSSQSFQPGHLTQGGLCTSGPHWVCAIERSKMTKTRDFTHTQRRNG